MSLRGRCVWLLRKCLNKQTLLVGLACYCALLDSDERRRRKHGCNLPFRAYISNNVVELAEVDFLLDFMFPFFFIR